MKRILTALAIVAVMIPVISSCKKGDKKKGDVTPKITWEANSKFSTVEISSDMDAVIVVSAPEGIDVLQIEATVPITMVGIINQYIGTNSNKATSSRATAILDLLDDNTVGTKFRAQGIASNGGTSLKGKNSVTLNLGKFIQLLTADQEIENTTFKFKINLTDEAGKSTTKTATFHWTPGPQITVPSESVNINTASPVCKISVVADGKIAQIDITPSGDAAIVNLVKSRTSSGESTIHLCTDAKAETGLSLPKISDLLNKTKATIDLRGMLSLFGAVATSAESTLAITVTDANGKVANASIKLVKE